MIVPSARLPASLLLAASLALGLGGTTAWVGNEDAVERLQVAEALHQKGSDTRDILLNLRDLSYARRLVDAPNDQDALTRWNNANRWLSGTGLVNVQRLDHPQTFATDIKRIQLEYQAAIVLSQTDPGTAKLQTLALWSDSQRILRILEKNVVSIDQSLTETVRQARSMQENSANIMALSSVIGSFSLAAAFLLLRRRATHLEMSAHRREILLEGAIALQQAKTEKDVEHAVDMTTTKLLGYTKNPRHARLGIRIPVKVSEEEAEETMGPLLPTAKLALERIDLLRKLEETSTKDPLTGLNNRRAFQHFAENILQKQQTYSETCVAVLDIDHFKYINDHFGHQAGDEVLRDVSAAVQARLRTQDILCRWGGEELAILMPECSPKTAQLRLDHIREYVQTLRWSSIPKAITFSGGITKMLPLESLDAALSRADKALYDAKAGGRNQIRLIHA